jgi:hypothetical protein
MEPQLLPCIEMFALEGVNLQQGMNFRLGGQYSVFLMSVQQKQAAICHLPLHLGSQMSISCGRSRAVP